MRKAGPSILVLVVLTLIPCAGCKKRPSDSQKPDSSRPSATTSTRQPTSSDSPAAAPKVAVPRPSDPAVAGVVDEMMAAWDKVQVVTATVETKLPEAAGHTGRTDGRGKYYLQKTNGKLLINFHLFNELKIKPREETMFVTGEVLDTVIDGNHVYTFLNQPPDHKKAAKKKLSYEDVLHIGGSYVFRELVRDNELSVLPEEMKENRATKVLKAKPKDKDAKWESMHYFDKATGIRVEMVELDADGKAKLTIKLPQIDTTTPIPPETFQYVVPEGVTLEDQTAAP